MSATSPTPSKDFRLFRSLALRAGISRYWGQFVCDMRDLVARGLRALRITPNGVTLAGLAVTVATAVCFLITASDDLASARATGRTAWVVAGFVLFFCACAFDMLDGALARIGGISTPLGAVLDSSLDRVSDMLLYVAIAAHFVWRGNLTYSLLAMLALSHTMMISYVKARAENMIPDCSVGYWLRGERCAAVLICAGGAHLPALLWQQGILPAFTVWRRLVWTHRVLDAQAGHRPPPDPGPFTDWRRWLAPWRFPRGSIPYDLVTGTNIAFLLFAPMLSPLFRGSSDPLRAAFAAIVATQ